METQVHTMPSVLVMEHDLPDNVVKDLNSYLDKYLKQKKRKSLAHTLVGQIQHGQQLLMDHDDDKVAEYRNIICSLGAEYINNPQSAQENIDSGNLPVLTFIKKGEAHLGGSFSMIEALLTLYEIIMKKDVVAGLGEIGYPILKFLSKKQITVGYDVDERLMNKSKFKKFQETQTSFLHIAIPVTSKFEPNILQLYKKFKPECIVMHSTVGPGTTEKIQEKLDVPLIYSATRGVHKRMLKDIKRYTKYFAISKNATKKQPR